MEGTGTITVYHGSESIIREPVFGKGNPRNDYGQGFYCTESPDLAKEWACTDSRGGYANRYSLNLEGLSILDLSDGEYTILHWLTELIQNRIFSLRSEISRSGRDYLIEQFGIDTSGYDIIRGYRADDSYFAFAQDFLDNTITVRKLSEAMRLGKLGEQIVLVSEKAFSRISFVGYEVAEQGLYYPLRKSRDELARSTYFSGRKATTITEEDLFLADIIRRRIDAHDPRLQ